MRDSRFENKKGAVLLFEDSSFNSFLTMVQPSCTQFISYSGSGLRVRDSFLTVVQPSRTQCISYGDTAHCNGAEMLLNSVSLAVVVPSA